MPQSNAIQYQTKSTFCVSQVLHLKIQIDLDSREYIQKQVKL